jgi:hypothetical protein
MRRIIETVIADYDLAFVSDVRSRSSYKLQIIHSFFVSSIFPVLVGDLAYLLIKREPFEREKRPNHVFTRSGIRKEELLINDKDLNLRRENTETDAIFA